MRRIDAIIVLLCCCTATSRAQRVAQADDKQLVDAVMEAVRAEVVKFAPGSLRATADAAWTVVVPEGSEWQRARIEFAQLVRARDTLAGDQIRYSLGIERGSRLADTAMFYAGIRTSVRMAACKDPWTRSSMGFDIVATRAPGQPWTVTPPSHEMMGDPAPCEPPDRIFGVEEAKFVDAAMQFLTAQMQRTDHIPIRPPHEVAWTIMLPPEAAWQNVAPRLKALLHARDSTKSDREFYALRIYQADVTPDSTRLVAVIDLYTRNSPGSPAQFTGSWSADFDANAHRTACGSWAMALDPTVIADPTCPPRPNVPRSPGAHPSAATSRAQRAPAPADDKQLVDAVMDTVRAQVVHFALYPRQPTADVAWTIAFPADSEWQRAAREFKRFVRARDTLPSDTIRYSLQVTRTGRFADKATYLVDYEVRNRFSCPTNIQWIGGGDSFDLTAIRRDRGIWEVRMGEVLDGLPGMCVPPRAELLAVFAQAPR